MNYKRMRKQIYAWCGTLLVTGSLMACGAQTAAQGTEKSLTKEDTSENSVKASGTQNADGKVSSSENGAITIEKLKQEDLFSDKDREVGYDESSCTKIELADKATTCTGDGASVEGDVVTITKKGTYLLSGSLSNGQIVVDAGDEKVRLILDGVSVNCGTSAAIYVKQADKVFVTLASGSKNQLSNEKEFVDIDDNAIDAVVYSKDDLTFNGDGSLEINAKYGHGIVSKDDLKFAGGTYQITAENHALSGKDSVAILDGTFTLTAGKDGIHSENDEDQKGYVFIEDGTFTITAEGDGVDASYLVQIEDGSFDITAGGGSVNAEETKQQENFQRGDKTGVRPDGDENFQKGQKDEDGNEYGSNPNGDERFEKGRKGQFGGKRRGYSGDSSENSGGEQTDRPEGMPEPPSGDWSDGNRPEGIPEPPSGDWSDGNRPEGMPEAQGGAQSGDMQEQPSVGATTISTKSADSTVADKTDKNTTKQVETMDKAGTTEAASRDAADASEGENSDNTASVKGIKAGVMIFLDGGNLKIDAADDTIHSNGSVQIDGGEMTLSSGDDGVHADEVLLVNNGTIDVTKSYEGLEGLTITINDGVIKVVSRDDGLNAAGGADQSGFGGGMGSDSFGASEDCWIEINGGALNVDASGDGIDSNGNMTINGGEIYVQGPENNGNAALDFGDGAKAVMNGGTLIATGCSGMAENFDSSSTQCSMLVQLDGTCTGEVALKDSTGATLLAYTSDKSYNSVYFSSSDLKQGETYTVVAQGNEKTVELTDANYSDVQSRGFNR